MRFKIGNARLVLDGNNFYDFETALEIVGGSEVTVNGNNFVDCGMAVDISGAKSLAAKNNITSSQPISERPRKFHFNTRDLRPSVGPEMRNYDAEARKAIPKQNGRLSQDSLEFCINRLREL